MVFELLIFVFVGVIAFYHFTQGLFSATLSAIIATVAAVIAVSYHENLAALIAPKFPEQADAISLTMIFAVVYILLRIGFDILVPGNVRLPVLVDKIGAAAVGVVVGLLGTGVVAVAAQTLPLGPTIAGYTRFEPYHDTQKDLPAGDRLGHYRDAKHPQVQDVLLHDVLKDDSIDPAIAEEKHLWFYCDDLVIALVRKLSDAGSLANDRPLASIHPEYLDELFGQRLGIQIGARHTLLSTDSNGAMKVMGLYTRDKLPQMDSEMQDIRQRDPEKPLPKNLEPASGQKMVIVRVTFGDAKDIADEADSFFRYSPGSIRLLAAEQAPGDQSVQYKDYHPVATLHPKGFALAHGVDDYMFSDMSKPKTVDFIFLVDNEAFTQVKTEPYVLRDGSFLEIKRYGLADLSGGKVASKIPASPDPDGGVLIKPELQKDFDKLPNYFLESSPPAEGQAH